MASELVLPRTGDRPEERRPLDDRDEEVLAHVFAELALYTTTPAQAAILHERGGEAIAAWDNAGALRLARALPPAYAELAVELRSRYE
jgi:hypothetical protein